ncbi:MAG: energy-coupling factor transporter ATPase [Propionicimonas sp.]
MAELRVEGLGYRYPKATADSLNDVDLDFPSGGLTVVMGRTGAGKSTLLMALNGVVPQLTGGRLRGSVRLDGADLADYRAQTIAEFIGLVLQDAESQLLGRTVAEDVAFGPRNHLVPPDEIRQRVAEALHRVGLAGFEGRDTASLSGGEKQRLAIAGVLAQRPQVLCLDEPTSELDPAGRAEVYRVVDELRAGGVTVLAVEQDPAEGVVRADHLVVLDAGRVAWQGPPAEFFRGGTDLGVRPLPIAELGRELERSGLIERQQVPVDVDAAEWLIRQLTQGRPLPAPAVTPSPPTAVEPVVELRQLSHRYADAGGGLNGIDLTIGWGEYVALVGRNGAGKTTLARHLNGLLQPTAGTVTINGLAAAGRPPWELARHVGYVFQNPDHQIFNATVDAEVRYGLKLAGLPASEIDARVAEVLQRTGLAQFRDAHPFALGKGLRQRLAVASVLAMRPAILVVDEPTTGQDWAGVQAMMALIDQLNAEGTTIVLISHDLEVVARHARRVVVLDAGEVVADGATAEVLGEPAVLARAGLPTTQLVELSRRLWPDRPPLLDEVALGRHLVAVLAGDGR